MPCAPPGGNKPHGVCRAIALVWLHTGKLATLLLLLFSWLSAFRLRCCSPSRMLVTEARSAWKHPMGQFHFMPCLLLHTRFQHGRARVMEQQGSSENTASNGSSHWSHFLLRCGEMKWYDALWENVNMPGNYAYVLTIQLYFLHGSVESPTSNAQANLKFTKSRAKGFPGRCF